MVVVEGSSWCLIKGAPTFKLHLVWCPGGLEGKGTSTAGGFSGWSVWEEQVWESESPRVLGSPGVRSAWSGQQCPFSSCTGQCTRPRTWGLRVALPGGTHSAQLPPLNRARWRASPGCPRPLTWATGLPVLLPGYSHQSGWKSFLPHRQGAVGSLDIKLSS